MFAEKEFEEACASLQKPDFHGFEIFVDIGDVTIYRQYREVRNYCN